MTKSLTYVYCLVRSARRPSLRNRPSGVPGGAETRALDAGQGLWLIAASVPANAYGAAALERGLQDLAWVGRHAMGHEAVVESFLSAPALVPLQLFTLFTSDDRALADVNRGRARIERTAERVAGQLEWGLRLTFDERGARAAMELGHTDGQDGPSAGAGTTYLTRKGAMRETMRAQVAEAVADVDRLYRELSRLATESRRRTFDEPAAGSRLLLDAVFLVPARRAGAFRTALRRRARTLAPGVVVALTGPWPPYNFIDVPERAGRARTSRPGTPVTAARTPAAGAVPSSRRRSSR